jgi:glutathione synthase/RimK-type ligase-like ATP-grasp enzyme
LKPKVLIATTNTWVATARLGMALAATGFTVEALCSSGHPLRKTKAVSRTYSYSGLSALGSFKRAIETAKPDLIIPGDDLAAGHLHDLHRRAKRKASGSEVCELIERSIGRPESYRLLYERASFIQIAQQEGIRAPRTEAVATHADLRRWISRVGLPVVLKANGSSGGDGVRIARTVEEAHRAFQKLQAPPVLARAAKRALIDNDQSLIWRSVLRRRHVVNAQEFVDGREATSTIACWNGELLAALHFEVLEKVSSFGHATVLRTIEHPEMYAAVEKVAGRLNLSGLYGLDFMLSENGDAHLVEVNPRTTQVGHLSMGEGRNLPVALFMALTGKQPLTRAGVIENTTIALFPQEWVRDAASPYLRSAYHDVPVEEPKLIEECLRRVGKNGRDPRQLMNSPISSPKYQASRDTLRHEPLIAGEMIAREMGSRYE